MLDQVVIMIIDPQALKLSIDEFKQNGFTSPLNWYKAFVNKLTPRDDGGTHPYFNC